jgi:hypothetical protein
MGFPKKNRPTGKGQAGIISWIKKSVSLHRLTDDYSFLG